MKGSFLISYEQKLRSFEKKLRKLIFDFLDKKGNCKERNNY